MEKESSGHLCTIEAKGKILREQEERYYPTKMCFVMLQHGIEVGANSCFLEEISKHLRRVGSN